MIAVTPPCSSTAQELAERADLRYVCDRETPGFTRRRQGSGFVYFDTKGRRIRNGPHRRRIEQLVIPPAWIDVWICPDANGHLQATGRDDRGRKQYLYHPRWREISNQTKFDRMLHFGEALPSIRKQIQHDVARGTLDRRKVAATIVELLDRTLIRVGNREYASENDSYGLTTLTDRHVRINGSHVRFRFRGKSGKFHEVDLHDRRLANIIQRCQDIPGQELFQFRNGDGSFVPVGSADVNAYLDEITPHHFTAKDFRTWRGSAITLGLLCEIVQQDDHRIPKKTVQEAVKHTAAALGNTCAVCRKYYIHPRVIDLYLAGELRDHHKSFRPRSGHALDANEQLLLHVLRKLAARPA